MHKTRILALEFWGFSQHIESHNESTMERICFKQKRISESTSPSWEKKQPKPLQHQHFSGEKNDSLTQPGWKKKTPRANSKFPTQKSRYPPCVSTRAHEEGWSCFSSSYFLGNKSNDGPVSQPQSNLVGKNGEAHGMGRNTLLWGVEKREKFARFWATFLFGVGQVGESMARIVDEAILKKTTYTSIKLL